MWLTVMFVPFGQRVGRGKERWLGVSSSWLLPGAGQLYAGYKSRGLAFLSLAVFLHVLLLLSLMSKLSIFVSFAIGLCKSVILRLFACVDAFKLAKRSNSDEFEAIRATGKDPWLAVFLSLVLPGFGHAYLGKWVIVILYLFLFVVFGILSKRVVYALVALVLLRVFACAHVYVVSPADRKQNNWAITVFVIFLVSVLCFKDILIPCVTAKYMLPRCNPTVGTSMEPTLQTRDKIIINKLAYVWRNPQVGDVVALEVPKSVRKKSGITLVKRIVGIGGETVQVESCRVYVNGKERRFKILKDLPRSFEPENEKSNGKKLRGPEAKFGVAEPYVVPIGRYFVMGDNIHNSVDSRHFGPVPKKAIIGKVTKIYWPPSRTRVLR